MSRILFHFFLDDLRHGSCLVDGSRPAIGDEPVVLYNVHIAVVVVLVERVEAAFVAHESSRALFFVTAAIVLLSVEVTPNAIHVAFLSVGYEIRSSSAPFDRLIPSLDILNQRMLRVD